MILDHAKIEKIQFFLNRLEQETYPEPPSSLHGTITRRMLDHFHQNYPFEQMQRILDIGCGQGGAIDLFHQLGKQAVGVTLNQEDVTQCRARGLEVYYMDQSFLDFPDGSFDLAWCRHCLEHSAFPLLTLWEFFRVITPGGYLYVEVPAPGTACHHEQNPNHYSVFGKEMWSCLFRRTGFSIRESLDIDFKAKIGPDTYWSFILKKPLMT